MRRSRKARDGGGVTVEFGAILPLVLFVVVMCFEALIVATTVERVENAARSGAREASKKQNPGVCAGVARASMPTWINEIRDIRGSQVGETGVSCKVTVMVPILWKNLGDDFEFKVDRTVTMPMG